MNPTTGTFVSQSSTHASMNFAISYGTIKITIPHFTTKMPLVCFAWLNSALKRRHKPIIHSLN